MTPCRQLLATFSIALTACGCSSTGGQLGTLQTQNRSLIEQNKAQLAEMENLKTHSRRLEDKLLETERRIAVQEQLDKTSPHTTASGPASSLFERSAAAPDHSGASSGAQSNQRR